MINLFHFAEFELLNCFLKDDFMDPPPPPLPAVAWLSGLFLHFYLIWARIIFL